MGSHRYESVIYQALVDLEFAFGYYKIWYRKAANLGWQGRSYKLSKSNDSLFSFKYLQHGNLFVAIQDVPLSYEDLENLEQALAVAAEALI